MTRLAWTLARAGGLSRMLLVALCTAVVSGLLLVAVAMLLLPSQPGELLSNLVADPGVRGGTTFATVLLTVPALLLLHQAVRLGSAAREHRLAGLRLAGATPAEVSRLGALEVALPAGVGSVLGLGVYALLRAAFGGLRHGGPGGWLGTGADLRLVPASVAPAWWQVAVVVIAATVTGAWVGTLPSRRLVVSPLGVTRRQPAAPPRPWGLLLMLTAVVLAPVGLTAGADSTAVGVAGVGLAVVGIASLGPWVAYRFGQRMRTRARSAAMLLAASRIAADPRPVGRAAAAVGGIALVSGGAVVIAADLVSMRYGDPSAVFSVLLVLVLLLAALAVVAWTLAVHTVESLMDRRRSTAALVAEGVSRSDLEQAQRLECALTALPLAVAGVVLGTATLAWVAEVNALGLLLMAVNLVVTPVLVWLMIVLAVRLVRPWTVRASVATNLRTE